MTEHAYDGEDDPYGYREHIARLERQRFWMPLLTAAVGITVYYFKDFEFSEAEHMMVSAVGLGVWAIFNEVRAARIEALKYQARKEVADLRPSRR